MRWYVSWLVLPCLGLLAWGCAGGCGDPGCENDLDCADGDECTLDICAPDGRCSWQDDSLRCADDNPCTDDRCDVLQGCLNSPNTSPCDDGDACTLGDRCGGGLCLAGPGPPVCRDGNPCTTDSCDPAVGCVFLDNLDPCDDGDACTESDQCLGGECLGLAINCEDQNPCTDDLCQPDQGCLYVDNALPCDDGDACTLGDGCASGACLSGPDAPDCDDGNLCTSDSCSPDSGCENAPNSLGCDDGNLCTLGDGCREGSCWPGETPLDCDDGNWCTQDSCLALSGCSHQDVSASCADDLICTRDSCFPEQGCINEACSPFATCQAEGCLCAAGYEGDGFECLAVCGDAQCLPGEDALSCGSDCDFDLVVVVPSLLLSGLQSGLEQYVADALDMGWRVYVQEWTGGDETGLRTLLHQQYSTRAVEGAWLVGDLPVAWYQQVAFDEYEEFPFDVFLMDLDATFSDGDGDGIYDSHTSLQAEIYVSRLMGSESQLVAYLAKDHQHHLAGPALPAAAFNFMDDEWSAFGGTYGLEYMYADLDLVSDMAQSTCAAYLDRLTGAGVEFVFQWIHSTPSQMHIYGVGEGWVDTAQIESENHKAHFVNMFNCSGARVTEENLGLTYLTRTDWGLAVVGTTKVGGMVTPRPFHNPLGQGLAWGPAFRQWYNHTGAFDDEWFLGMLILGDPLLTVSHTATLKMSAISPERALDKGALRRIMKRQAQAANNGSFAQYRATRP